MLMIHRRRWVFLFVLHTDMIMTTRITVLFTSAHVHEHESLWWSFSGNGGWSSGAKVTVATGALYSMRK